MKIIRKTFLFSTILLALSIGPPTKRSFAIGTSAGTTITNQAVVHYTIPSEGDYSTTSNLSSFYIDEIIRLNVAWQTTASTAVVPGSQNQHIPLVLTNTGNGKESFDLSIVTSLSGDQFDPIAAGLFLDNNGNGIYEPAVDLTPANTVELFADETIRVFVVNNIPETRSDNSKLQDGDTGLFNINITNSHGNGIAGTVFAGEGDNGVRAIFGQDFPTTLSGQYLVETVGVTITKSSETKDKSGGSQAQPGAEITYTLAISVIGSGTIYDLVITDPIPSDTTYVAETITLNGIPLSDTADGDAGQSIGIPVDLIRVNLGNQTAGDHSISFKVTIDK